MPLSGAAQSQFQARYRDLEIRLRHRLRGLGLDLGRTRIDLRSQLLLELRRFCLSAFSPVRKARLLRLHVFVGIRQRGWFLWCLDVNGELWLHYLLSLF